jgi:hypothetical protein
VGEALGVDWRTAAEHVVHAAVRKIAAVVSEAVGVERLLSPSLIGVGGGAGAVVPRLAEALGLAWSIPTDAEVISSVGDALSLVRVEVERSVDKVDHAAIAHMHQEVEEAAVRAGAAAESLRVESEVVPERRALRVVAFGAAALHGTELNESVDHETLLVAASESLGTEPLRAAQNDFYTVFTSGTGDACRFAVVDRSGGVATEGRGRVLFGDADKVRDAAEVAVQELTHHIGPVSVAPAIKVLRGARLIDLTLFSSPDRLLEAVRAETSLAAAAEQQVVAFVART